MAFVLDYKLQGTDCGTAAGCNTAKCRPIPEETVGMMLDARIQLARERVEQLCVIKAKAEAANILHFPRSFIETTLYN